MSVLDGLVYIICGASLVVGVIMTFAFIGSYQETVKLKKLLLRKSLADLKEAKDKQDRREGLN
jgi:hypothetical protein